MGSNVVSIKIRSSKIVDIKGSFNGLTNLLSGFAENVSRGYIEIHDENVQPFEKFFEDFPKVPGYVRDSYFLLESYRANVGLFLLYRNGRLVLMTNKDFVAYDNFYAFIDAFLRKIDEKTRIFRFCVMTPSALDKSMEILREINLSGCFEIQIDLMGATLLTELTCLVEKFNIIHVFKSPSNFISIRGNIGKIEIYSDTIGADVLVKIMRMIIDIMKYAPSIDLDATYPAATGVTLQVIRDLLKEYVDYIYISPQKMIFEKEDTYVTLSLKTTITKENILEKSIQKMLELLFSKCPARIHLDDSGLAIRKIGSCR